MSNATLHMPKGTFDSQLAKVVFGDEVTRQRGPWSDQQQEAASGKLIAWLAAALPGVIERNATEIDQVLISRLHGKHLRVVIQWFSENSPSVANDMPVVSRYMLAMGRAVGYNRLFQPAPLARLRQVLESEAGTTTGGF